jgi:iron complex outermembrane receptor protein
LHYSKRINDELSFNAALHYTYGRGYYENYKDSRTLSHYLKNPVVAPRDPYIITTPIDTFIVNNDTVIDYPDTIVDYPDTIKYGDLVWQKWLDNDFYGATFSVKYNNNYINLIVGGAGNVYDGRHFGKVIWGQFLGDNNTKTDSLISKDIEWYSGTSIKSDYNIFAKLNWFVTEKINVYADLQVRTVKHTMNGYDEDSTKYDITAEYLFVNPKAGVSFHPNDKLNFYAFAGISHREPNRDDFIGYLYASKQVQPEQLFDIETGMNYSARNIRLNVNLYRMNYINQLINTGELNNVGSPIRVNVPKSYRQGIETEISYKPLKDLEIALNTALSNNVIQSEFVRYYDQYDENWNWTGTVVDTVKNGVLPYSPSLVAGMYVDFTPLEGLHLSVLGKYVSSQYLDNSGDAESTIPAYSVGTWKVSYDFGWKDFKRISVFVSLHNIFHDKPFPTNGWVYPYYMGNTKYNMIAYYPEANKYWNAGITIKF